MTRVNHLFMDKKKKHQKFSIQHRQSENCHIDFINLWLNKIVIFHTHWSHKFMGEKKNHSLHWLSLMRNLSFTWHSNCAHYFFVKTWLRPTHSSSLNCLSLSLSRSPSFCVFVLKWIEFGRKSNDCIKFSFWFDMNKSFVLNDMNG